VLHYVEGHMERLLLSPTQVAEMLGIGRPTVYSLLARGELPSVRFGRAVRVPLAALTRWIETRARGSLPVAEPEESAASPK
jgi:excisionase family DNA binding protein